MEKVTSSPNYLIALSVALSMFVQSCAIVGYGTRPKDAWDAEPSSQKYNSKLYYHITDFGGLTFGGYDELRSIMRSNRLFAQTEQASEAPKQGAFLKIETKNHDPSVGCVVWGYISLALLFTLPAYCGSSGFYVQYHVYKDGQEKKLYEYQIKRRAFAWLPMIVFVWANLITSSEEEAFEAVTNQFFEDAVKDKVFEQS